MGVELTENTSNLLKTTAIMSHEQGHVELQMGKETTAQTLMSAVKVDVSNLQLEAAMNIKVEQTVNIKIPLKNVAVSYENAHIESAPVEKTKVIDGPNKKVTVTTKK